MRKIILGIFFLFCCFPTASFAIAFNAAAGTALQTNTGGNLTTSFTTAGTNIAVVVWALQTDSVNDRVTGVTWNGVALTRVGRQPFAASPGSDLEEYVLVGAASGTHNVVITTSVGTSISYAGIIASYTGVAGSNATSTGNSLAQTSLMTSVTTTVDNSWTLLGLSANGTTHNAGTATTRRIDVAATETAIFDSNAPITPPGSNTLNVTSTSQNYIWGMVSLSPVVVPPAPIFLLKGGTFLLKGGFFNII